MGFQKLLKHQNASQISSKKLMVRNMFRQFSMNSWTIRRIKDNSEILHLELLLLKEILKANVNY